MSKCGPQHREEFYCEEEDLVLKDCCNDRAQLRYHPDGAPYCEGELLMQNPDDPLTVIQWDGVDKTKICGLVTCDIDAFIDPSIPCPQQSQIGGRINPRKVLWLKSMTLEAIQLCIANPKKEHCFIFQGMLDGCPPLDAELLKKAANVKTTDTIRDAGGLAAATNNGAGQA